MPDAGDRFRESVIELGTITLETLYTFEAVARRLHPNVAEQLRDRVAPLRDRVGEARGRFAEADVPESYGAVAIRLRAS